jgi:hypothetical protein
VQLHEAWGRPGQVKEWREKRDAERGKPQPP